MRRWIVIGTAVVTMIGGVGVTAAQAQLQTPHAPILIVGDGDFTAANGVTNPIGCGTMGNPCRIENWSISPPPSGECIRIDTTTKFYLIRNNRCTGGSSGIALLSANNGTVRNNTITHLRAPTFFSAFGILAGLGSSDLTVTDNQLSDFQGTEASGIGLFQASNVTVARNVISQMMSRSGEPGAPGTPDGGIGGSGGNVYGIRAQSPFGASNLVIENNVVSLLYAGSGAAGGNGAAGGDGGNGGGGGFVWGVLTSGYTNVTTQGNNIGLLRAGLGGRGGFGGLGGNGGDGGPGGAAFGMEHGFVNGVSNAGNIISGVYGAGGGLGGFAGFGGTGGDGGHGGDAIGIFLQFASGVTNTGNLIAAFFAGLGGLGAFPGGVNGTPGTAAPIQII